LHGKIDGALVGGPISLALVAFFAVAREGLETALFVYTNFKTVGVASTATVGLVLGLALAVFLGYAIYNRSVKLDLSKFFKITGVALIIIAAGVLSYGIHEFQELGYLPGVDNFLWDVTPWIAKESLLASLLGGLVGFDTTTSFVQFFFWSLYLVAVLIPYLSKEKSSVAPKVASKA
jgi:high-affinity iron transporter